MCSNARANAKDRSRTCLEGSASSFLASDGRGPNFEYQQVHDMSGYVVIFHGVLVLGQNICFCNGCMKDLAQEIENTCVLAQSDQSLIQPLYISRLGEQESNTMQ